MNTARLLLLWVCLPCVGFGAALSVSQSPEWQPASEAQAKALTGDPGYRVIDFSIGTSGGAGLVLEAPAKAVVDKRFLEGSVLGFVTAARKGGQTIVDQQPCAIGVLKGVRITMTGAAKGRAIGAVSYLVFSDRAMYAVTVYGPPGLKASDALVERYLARIRVDPAVVPGAIERNAPFSLGRLFGRQSVMVFLGSALLTVLVVAAILYAHRRRHPGPLAA